MIIREAMLAALGLATIVHLNGCATAEATRADSGQASTYVKQLEDERKRSATLEAELQAKDAQLEVAQSQLAERTAAAPTAPMGASLLPPNPKPGECYARVLIPARYEAKTQTVLKREPSERIEIIPARYETVEERVLVKEASTRLEVVPAVYEEVKERVLVKPASTELVEIPAEYGTVTERVLVKPAHTMWKRGPSANQKGTVISEAVSDTGELMCLVEVPATYETVERQVIVSPAKTEKRTVPAEYDTIVKRVVKSPASTREVTIPAEYKTVTTIKLVRDAQERRVDIPAEYETVTETQKVTDERVEWRSVLCEVNMTADNIMALQKALAGKGYYNGPIDGIIGPQTLSAVNAYAKKRNLPHGSSYITLEVIEDLGLSQRIAGLI